MKVANAYNIAGAFVAAPFGGLLWAFAACGLRIAFLWVMARVKGHRFDAFDRPIPQHVRRPSAVDEHENEAVLTQSIQPGHSGKFF